MTILIMITTSVVFFFGVMVGQKLSKGKDIELPKAKNIPFTKEYREDKKKSEDTKEFLEQMNKTAKYIEDFNAEE